MGFFGLTVHQQRSLEERCTAHGGKKSYKTGYTEVVPSWNWKIKTGEFTDARIWEIDMSFVKRGVIRMGPKNISAHK